MTGAVPEPARLPHLVVVEGEGAGRSFALTKPTTIIGRDPNTDIVLPHATVSWHHAAITVGPEGIVAEDLESLNGTFVGVARIGRRSLAHGDVLAVGHRAALKLTVLASDSETRAQAETPAEGSIALAANAAGLAERLRKERASAAPEGVSLVLMFVRIDGAFRHTEVSEAVMRRIAVVCRAAMDAGDMLARASDQEFILLLRQTIGRAVRTAGKIRNLAAKQLTAKQLKGTGAAGGALIATAALVPLPAHTARSAEALLRVASRKAGRSLRRARHGSDAVLRPTDRTTDRTTNDR